MQYRRRANPLGGGGVAFSLERHPPVVAEQTVSLLQENPIGWLQTESDEYLTAENGETLEIEL